MTEPDGVMQVRGEATRGKGGKGGKGRAIIKRGKTEGVSASPQDMPVEGSPSGNRSAMVQDSGATATRDPEVLASIQQRAYMLFEAGGYDHGHDLEHWLEAERQIRDSSERSER